MHGGPSSTVGLFHFSFVWPVNYINYISTIYSTTCSVTIVLIWFPIASHVLNLLLCSMERKNIPCSYYSSTLLKPKGYFDQNLVARVSANTDNGHIMCYCSTLTCA